MASDKSVIMYTTEELELINKAYNLLSNTLIAFIKQKHNNMTDIFHIIDKLCDSKNLSSSQKKELSDMAQSKLMTLYHYIVFNKISCFNKHMPSQQEIYKMFKDIFPTVDLKLKPLSVSLT